MRENSLKSAWGRGESTLGLWLSANDSVMAEIVGGAVVGEAGIDYLNIDMQHGLADYDSVLSILQATRTSDATVTVRVPWNDPGIIGRVLDAGAMGVIIPMVNTVEQAEQAVASCRYAPAGSRSYGPIRAGVVHGPDYAAQANGQIACIPMIETVEAIENLDGILSVPGIDAIYVGPADLSLTLGLPPGSDHDDERFTEALATIVATAKRHGIVPGMHTTERLVAKRLDQGFRMLTVTSDLNALQAGIRRAFAIARGEIDLEGGSGSIY